MRKGSARSGVERQLGNGLLTPHSGSVAAAGRAGPASERSPTLIFMAAQGSEVNLRTTRPGLRLGALAAGDEVELLRIHRTPEVRRWWEDPAEGFPWDEPEAVRFTIEVDEAIAGLIQFSEELEPKYRHASVDMFLDPALHGQGYGSAALSTVVRYLIQERAHHRITVDPAADNQLAIGAYRKAGFREVGIMRQYERDLSGDGWHDGLLMELLASERR